MFIRLQATGTTQVGTTVYELEVPTDAARAIRQLVEFLRRIDTAREVVALLEEMRALAGVAES